jgi:CBS domain-containing protein
MSTTVKDVMTTRVVSVNEDVAFKEIAASLRRHRVSALPVIGGDRTVIGVVSEADLLTKQALDASDGREPRPISDLRHRKDRAKFGAITAAELMTSSAVTISPDEPVAHAARLMYLCEVKQLPVVDADNHLVGIVNRADVLSVYDRPDAEIQREIQDRVIPEKCVADADRFAVTVVVNDGIVTLEGHLETSRSGHEIVPAAWHVEGVVAVRDRLVYPAAPVCAVGLLA